MNWLSELARRLNMLPHRRRFDAELEAEMRLHLELRRLEQFEHGMRAEDAQAATRRRFGNTTYLHEESHIVWGWTWLENLAQDIRFGARALLRERGVSALCVLILALGIGASTALYSVWKSALVLLTIFAVVAVILAGAGVYALLAYNVSQRSREIGIRLARRAPEAHTRLGPAIRRSTGSLWCDRRNRRRHYRHSTNDLPAVPGKCLQSFRFRRRRRCAARIRAPRVLRPRATRVDPLAALRDE
jgi:hypothetical protein